MSREVDSISPDKTSGDGFAVALRDGEIALFSHGGAPMSLFDPADGRILEVNDAWVAKYGYSRAEAHAMRVQDVSAEPQATTAAVKGAQANGGAVIDVRWHHDKSGKVFPVDVMSGTLRIGSRVLMYAVLHDIEDRIAAERRLQQSEARFRSLVEHLPIGIVVHRAGRIVYVNPGLRTILGFGSGDEIVGKNLLDVVHPDDRDEVRRRIAAVVKMGSNTPAMQGRMVNRSGEAVPVEVTAIPFEFDGEPAVLAMASDQRRRQFLEAQLVLADRLASLGRLAASVGHEINNPLAYVLGNVELLQRDLSALGAVDPELHARLQERMQVLEAGVLRMRDIVRDLKTLTVGEPDQVEGTDLHRVLDLCVSMAEHAIRGRASLVCEYGSPVTIRASEQRLSQVFLNLLVNAAQAIPEGNVDGNEVRIVTRQPAPDRVEVLVSDTGGGVPASVRDRIFEPFFTTKQSGGTGLGLSICHSIVTALGGSINVEDRDPHGTCFRVDLPCLAPL